MKKVVLLSKMRQPFYGIIYVFLINCGAVVSSSSTACAVPLPRWGRLINNIVQLSKLRFVGNFRKFIIIATLFL